MGHRGRNGGIRRLCHCSRQIKGKFALRVGLLISHPFRSFINPTAQKDNAFSGLKVQMDEIVGIDVYFGSLGNAPLEACSCRNDDAIAIGAVLRCNFGCMPMTMEDEIALSLQTAPDPVAVKWSPTNPGNDEERRSSNQNPRSDPEAHESAVRPQAQIHNHSNLSCMRLCGVCTTRRS